jgi:hypothetical protein
VLHQAARGLRVMRGVKRAPASMTEIVPEGAKFGEGTYSNKAGSRTYKLFVPKGYRQGQPIPLQICRRFASAIAAAREAILQRAGQFSRSPARSPCCLLGRRWIHRASSSRAKT